MKSLGEGAGRAIPEERKYAKVEELSMAGREGEDMRESRRNTSTTQHLQLHPGRASASVVQRGAQWSSKVSMGYDGLSMDVGRFRMT